MPSSTPEGQFDGRSEDIVDDDDEDDITEVNEQAVCLKKLEEYEQEIKRLHDERQQLAKQQAEKELTALLRDMLRQAEETKRALAQEVEDMRKNTDANIPWRGASPFHARIEANLIPLYKTSPLSQELQQHPWSSNYKPRIPPYDGQSNPKKFLASYETAVISAGGDVQALAKSFILAAEGVAHEWYITLKPLSIRSWDQLKKEIPATFRGYQPETKTTRDLMNCVQRDDEPLADYIKHFIQVKAQAPNVPEAAVIAAATEGLATGQCAAYLARSPPDTVTELFTIMNQYAKSDTDFRRRKATRKSANQAGKAPQQPQQFLNNQRNVRPFRAINNLQEESGNSNPEARRQSSGPQQRGYDNPPRG